MDQINWSNVEGTKLLQLSTIGTLELSGIIRLNEIPTDAEIVLYQNAFGQDVFKYGNSLYITGPEGVRIKGPATVLEGSETLYEAVIFSENPGEYNFSIKNGIKDGSTYHAANREGVTLYSDTGLLKVEENGEDNCDIIIVLQHRSQTGITRRIESTIHIKKRTYPTDQDVTILGDTNIVTKNIYTYTVTDNIDGSMYTV